MNNFKNLMRKIGKTSKFIDYPLLIAYVILCLIGLVMVYSASMVAATKGTLTGGVEVAGTYFYDRQLLYVILSFAIVFVIAFLLNGKILKNPQVQVGIMGTIILLLLLTLIIGKNINGSKSWINLGFMNLQASELLKIAIIMYIPFIIDRKMPRVKKRFYFNICTCGISFILFSACLFTARCWANIIDYYYIWFDIVIFRFRL